MNLIHYPADTTLPPTWPDLSPAVSIGGNAVEDTAALYDGDLTVTGQGDVAAALAEYAERVDQ